MTDKARCLALVFIYCIAAGIANAQSGGARIYNTVKEKLAAGEKVVGGTVTSSDPAIYCAMANGGYDFLWIEIPGSRENDLGMSRCAGYPVHPRS